MSSTTPAIVTRSAARRLPRWLLLLLCAAYVLPGFIGREPWKSADMASLGYMAELAAGRTAWLQPRLLELPPEFDGLLPYWLGAWAMQAAPAALAPEFAARLPFIALLVLALLGTWYGVYHLARSPGAQPVAFAFGGEAEPKDYARAMADGGLLALLACFGLAQLSHETTPALAQLGFAALALHGLAALPYRRTVAAASLGAGLAGLALSGAPTVALLLALGGTALCALDRPQDTARGSRLADAAIAAAAMLAAAGLATALDAWHWRIDQPFGGRSLQSIGRLLVWFTWPAWPLALWTLWRWRRQLLRRHLALPLWFAGVPLVGALMTAGSDRTLLLALPGLAALGAFALPTLRRSVASLVDWFTLLFFSSCGFIIWVVWISMQTGVPAKPAANVAKLAQGYQPSFGWLPFLLALGATAAWAWLVRWRASRARDEIWKSLALPAGGAALCWLLVMTLWLPVLDYARGYLPVVRNVRAAMAPGGCVEVFGLERAEIAALRIHGGLDLRPASLSPACPWLLAPLELNAAVQVALPEGAWSPVATVRRPADARDQIQVFRHRAGIQR